MVCFDCHIGYMLTHPEKSSYLKCNVCGYCVTTQEVKEYAAKAYKELAEEKGWDIKCDRLKHRTKSPS